MKYFEKLERIEKKQLKKLQKIYDINEIINKETIKKNKLDKLKEKEIDLKFEEQYAKLLENQQTKRDIENNKRVKRANISLNENFAKLFYDINEIKKNDLINKNLNIK
jgi:hypothetical protein